LWEGNVVCCFANSCDCDSNEDYEAYAQVGLGRVLSNYCLSSGVTPMMFPMLLIQFWLVGEEPVGAVKTVKPTTSKTANAANAATTSAKTSNVNKCDFFIVRSPLLNA